MNFPSVRIAVVSCWLALAILLAGCALEVPPPMPAAVGEDCVQSYDANKDYFPSKTNVEFAEGFTLSYYSNYKVLEVLSPWPGVEASETYLLVQCGTPRPSGFEDAYTIEVPVKSIIALSSTYLPHLELLDEVEVLVGLENDAWVYSEVIREMVQEGEVLAVGGGSAVDIETTLFLNPDLIIAFSSGFPDVDAHPVLRSADQNVFLNTEFREPTPLGRAEWFKTTAAFLNREADAETYFKEVAETYQTLVTLAQDQTERPTVLVNTPWEGVWYMAGGNSYVANYIADAGADYLWAEVQSQGSLFLDFEEVFARAQNADYWLQVGMHPDRASLTSVDPRFAEFKAYETGRLYNPDLRVSATGASDMFEGAVVRPHLVLADLIALFYPQLLPDHEFVYYRQLSE